MQPSTPRSLEELAVLIDGRPGWWRFPSEPVVRGFFGDGDVFFVGDQPSTSAWPVSDRGRRTFYDSLARAGLGNAHLTDLVKARGRASALADGLPPDFDVHVALLREELALLRPRRVVAVGELCRRLLAEHVPEVRPRLATVQHFAYAARPGRVPDYPSRLARAADMPVPDPVPPRPSAPSPPPADTSSGAALVKRVPCVPPGVRPLLWTLRRDNHGHHHGVVTWTGERVYLDLSWRPAKDRPSTPVAVFHMDLRGLLAGGFVRYEPEDIMGSRLRVRVVMRDDNTFALQVRSGSPAYPLP